MDHPDGPCFTVEDVEILEKTSVYEGLSSKCKSISYVIN